MATDRGDVIIVGGGIIGCLTAYLLAREGLKVTIIEADSVGSHAFWVRLRRTGSVGRSWDT